MSQKETLRHVKMIGQISRNKFVSKQIRKIERENKIIQDNREFMKRLVDIQKGNYVGD